MFDGGSGKIDIFANYLRYVEETEPPINFHRWCYIGGLAALIGRKAHVELGHFRVFPNLYLMLLGEPATRKSTAIKMLRKLLSTAGYETFAAEKTGKEKFLLDLEGLETDEIDLPNGKTSRKKYDTVTAETLWGGNEGEPKEVFIVADEFNDFAGPGNMDFYTTLGNLWDWDDESQPFSQRFKNSRSVSIYQPTISILSGNTPELFARCFPPEAIGSGFLSRLLLIHGERSGRKITFPPPPNQELGAALVKYFQALRSNHVGGLKPNEAAAKMLDDIYQTSSNLPDVRFKAYDNRRFTQLLRITVIFAAAKFQTEITPDDVIQANTVLAHAEIFMPKALGEFGKSKNSDVTNKIMSFIGLATKPVSIKDIWKQVHNDVVMKDCVELVQGLCQAEKIQIITTSTLTGYLPKKEVRKEPKYVDWNYLTPEERAMT